MKTKQRVFLLSQEFINKRRILSHRQYCHLLSYIEIYDHITLASKPLLTLEPKTSRFVQSMARYWGGEMETVRMGNLVSTYLHINKKGAYPPSDGECSSWMD